jgi:hypothetical protein
MIRINSRRREGNPRVSREKVRGRGRKPMLVGRKHRKQRISPV